MSARDQTQVIINIWRYLFNDWTVFPVWKIPSEGRTPWKATERQTCVALIAPLLLYRNKLGILRGLNHPWSCSVRNSPQKHHTSLAIGWKPMTCAILITVTLRTSQRCNKINPILSSRNFCSHVVTAGQARWCLPFFKHWRGFGDYGTLISP